MKSEAACCDLMHDGTEISSIDNPAVKMHHNKVPKPVEESEECRLLWDFPIQTDHKIDQKRTDIVVVTRRKGAAVQLISFSHLTIE